MINYKVNEYAVMAFSGPDQPVRVYLYGDQTGGDDSRYFGYIDFIETPETRFTVHANGIVNAFMPAEKLAAIVDLLRNESPVNFTVNETYNWAALRTGREPAGEGEM